MSHRRAGLLNLLALTAFAVCCQPGHSLASIYKGGEGNPVYRFLSDHAFLVRRNRVVPPVLLQYSDDADAPSLQSGASALRAVLLPDNETLLASFAESVGTSDPAIRRRLFIGVTVNHSTKKFTGKRFLRIIKLLGTNYLDLLVVAGRPCGHSQRDRLACGRNRPTRAFLHNWRNLLRLAKKRRILNLGLRHYPLPAVRAVHKLSTPECLDFPNRPTCGITLAKKNKKNNANSNNQKKKKQKKKKNSSIKVAKVATSSSKIDMHSAYSMRRAAGNVNFLSVVQAAFNPHHRHRVLRHWCHQHSVVLLADEALGGPHADELLADDRVTVAADSTHLPVRTAVLHWALKKRAAVAISPDEAAEFGSYLGVLAGKWRHLAGIDSTVESDMETRYFLVSPRDRSSSGMTANIHNEL